MVRYVFMRKVDQKSQTTKAAAKVHRPENRNMYKSTFDEYKVQIT